VALFRFCGLVARRFSTVAGHYTQNPRLTRDRHKLSPHAGHSICSKSMRRTSAGEIVVGQDPLYSPGKGWFSTGFLGSLLFSLLRWIQTIGLGNADDRDRHVVLRCLDFATVVAASGWAAEPPWNECSVLGLVEVRLADSALDARSESQTIQNLSMAHP